ncbi:MAG: NfeD family protein [Planctomycetota bacterium]|nr:NfeD family protein [Planctomycetota bacterium]
MLRAQDADAAPGPLAADPFAVDDAPPAAADKPVEAAPLALPADDNAGVGKIAAEDNEAAGDGAAAPPVQQAPPAYLVRLPIPITDNADNRFRAIVKRLLAKTPPGQQRPVLVIRFETGKSPDGRGTDFHRANGLAEFLTSDALNGVKTVAYIPKTIKGHAVLVAMACQQIVMDPKAEIGDAGIDDNAVALRKSAYLHFAKSEKTIPPALALGMLDKEATVIRAVTAAGTEYVLADELDALRKDRNVQTTEPISPRPGLFTGQRARMELGFVSYTASDVAGVAKALGLPESALTEDPSLERDWQPIQIELSGVIDEKMVHSVMRMIDSRAIKGSDNFICLKINSSGGDAANTTRLANYLAALDSSQIRTVAYIPQECTGLATVVAMACDEVIAAPNATIGGIGDVALEEGEVATARHVMRNSICKEKARSWSLPVALFDAKLKVWRYTHKDSSLTEYWSDEEYKEQPDQTVWQKGALFQDGTHALQVTGLRAEELGLVRQTVDSFQELRTMYSLGNDPTLVEPSMVDNFLRFLASDGVSLFLLLIGGAAVYAELQVPGVGLGGIIAFICFLLYFWAKFFEGTAGALEILLFVSGVGCLVIEIFVLPGIGVFGFAGGLMVVASLVLASQTFVIPHSDYELRQMRNSTMVVGGAAVGMIAIIGLLRRYLPHAPMFNRMMLAPPSAEEIEEMDNRESLVNFHHLLGKQGIAVTKLVPSGKANFGDDWIDVVSNGGFIDRGDPIVVVEVQGNRVVVGPVKS